MSELLIAAVSKQYGATKALTNFSLTVRDGSFVTLLGPSGCGKTTALRIAAGFEPFDSGRVLLDGHIVSHVPPHLRNMGMVFQNYSLFPHLTVLENVEFGLRMRKVPATTRRAKASGMLELVQVADLGSRYPHQISGGQQQRVALARALVIEPTVLLLDEPLSALDARVRAEVRDVIRDLQRRLGTTTLLVTHDQDEALAVSDTVCVMNAGTVEQAGSPEEIYGLPATPFVASFVGESTVVPGPQGTRIVRPENLRIVDSVDTRCDGTRGWVGRIEAVVFHGSTYTIDVRIPGFGTSVRCRVLHPEASSLEVSHEVGLLLVGDERH